MCVGVACVWAPRRGARAYRTYQMSVCVRWRCYELYLRSLTVMPRRFPPSRTRSTTWALRSRPSASRACTLPSPRCGAARARGREDRGTSDSKDWGRLYCGASAVPTLPIHACARAQSAIATHQPDLLRSSLRNARLNGKVRGRGPALPLASAPRTKRTAARLVRRRAHRSFAPASCCPLLVPPPPPLCCGVGPRQRVRAARVAGAPRGQAGQGPGLHGPRHQARAAGSQVRRPLGARWPK